MLHFDDIRVHVTLSLIVVNVNDNQRRHMERRFVKTTAAETSVSTSIMSTTAVTMSRDALVKTVTVIKPRIMYLLANDYFNCQFEFVHFILFCLVIVIDIDLTLSG